MSAERKIRVLIVEDDNLAAEAAKILLEDTGYLVIGRAENGARAVELTQSLKPDVILLDIQMPGMDGLAAARRINEVRPTPLVVLTADDRPELVAEAGRVGVGAFLRKPPNAEEMNRAIIVTLARFADLTALRELNERIVAEMEISAKRENQYHSIIRTTVDGFWMMDLDGRILEANQALVEMLGYSIPELLALRVQDIEAPETAGETREHIAAAGRSGKARFEARLRHKDGRILAVEISMNILAGEEKYIVFARDSTDRRRAEQALRESEQRYRELFENAPVGIFATTSDGRAILINPMMARILGYSSIAETLAHYTDLARQLYVRPERRAELVRQLAQDGKVENFVYEALTADRRRIWIGMNARIGRRQPDGSFIIEGFATEITDRVKAEAALKKSETKFMKIFQSSPIIMALSTSTDGIFIEVNQTFLDKLGYRKEEVIGHSSVSLGILGPEDRQNTFRFLSTTGTLKNLELSVRGKSGQLIPGLFSAEFIKFDEEKVLLTSFVDLSDRKRAEEEKAKLEVQLQQAMKMEAVGRLAGGVAHDFNNLLTGILGYADMLLAGLDPGNPIHEDLTEIRKAAESAANLTRQLLAFSRKQLIEPQIIDLNELIASLHKMLARLIGEDIELVITAGDKIGPVKIDPGQFEQILINLAINARDAMPDGGRLTIETANIDLDEEYCRRQAQISPGPFVRLSISDTGHGMNNDVKEHLFEPFFTTKPKGRGTGLGLATIYGAVKQSGGAIEVDSEEGRGTTFTLYLPRLSETAVPLKMNKPPLEISGGEETILVVEDENIVRELAIKFLSSLGYRVLHAPDGNQACQLVEKFAAPIDLLITDIVMPGMNGRQLAEILVKIHPEMKVLFTSGYTEDAIVRHGIIEEGLNFLAKPYSPYSLAIKIRKLLK
ncbi:MAG: PAS domain S-box protein [Myxococcales bacterium]|nr:PAS domain S-box protein [Myxococcales bacterium]